MTQRRLLAVGVGGLVLAMAGAIAVGTTGGRATLATVFEDPHGDYLLAGGLGLMALGAATAVTAHRSARGFDLVRPPAVERVPEGRPPGSDVDAALGGVTGLLAASSPTKRRRLRRRLRAVAVGAVQRIEHCSRATARRRVADGEWTDDPVAASFLAGDPEPDSLGAGPFLGGPFRFRRMARRTATTVVGLDEGDEEVGNS